MIATILTWLLDRPWWETVFLVVVVCLLLMLLTAALVANLTDRYHRHRDQMHGRCPVCGDDLTLTKLGCGQPDCPYFNKRGTE